MSFSYLLAPARPLSASFLNNTFILSSETHIPDDFSSYWFRVFNLLAFPLKSPGLENKIILQQ
jgi:hypothetical protein